MDAMSAVVTCKACGWEDAIYRFDPAYSCYHDARCPKCGSTNLDTSAVAAAWASEGRVYGYGARNTLLQTPVRGVNDK